MTWTTEDIGDLTGRTAVVTGVTGGLGSHAARQLLTHGADLVVTARDLMKAADTIAQFPSGHERVQVVELDLADLAGTKRVAAELGGRLDRIDILVNNAGIMVPPKATTKDGFELQMGTNHLGHFAWTATLWPLLARSSARIVTVSSIAHNGARGIDLSVLTPQGSTRRYRRWQAYAESKLANLMFALELDRRVRAVGLDVVSVAAHPGVAATNLTRTGSQLAGRSLPGMAMHQITGIVAQPAFAGAWPLLMAATDPTLTGGEYIGPTGLRGMRGRPGPAQPSAVARDENLADALWSASEQATGVTFDVVAP